MLTMLSPWCFTCFALATHAFMRTCRATPLPQAYVLSKAGAEAIVAKYWPRPQTPPRPPAGHGASHGAVLDDHNGAIGRPLEGIEVDLRPAVNFAADYLIFNAMP